LSLALLKGSKPVTKTLSMWKIYNTFASAQIRTFMVRKALVRLTEWSKKVELSRA
jgi:hypothetical protein